MLERWLAAAAASMLVACAGTAPVPTAAPPVPASEAAFWRGFGDPLLAELITDALAANHDLRVAAARYDAARALLRDARLDRLPVVTASAEASDVRASADQAPGVPRDQRDARSYGAAAVASWELDLFGRVRNGVAARRAERDAGAAELAAARVAVVAELASAYVALRGLQAQLAATNDNLENQRASLEIVRLRSDAGRGTQLDVARATAQLESTRALVPLLESDAQAAMHRIAVLTGREPDTLVLSLAAPSPLPVADAAPDLIAADVLRRRPDVIAAERRYRAATARSGIAAADAWPRVSLAGLLGSHAAGTGALFERDAETRLLTLGIDWSFLDFAGVRARSAAADAEARAALAGYEQAVLIALEDAANALTRHAHARRETDHLAAAAGAGAEAAALARLRFENGAADFLQVLDAERSQLDLDARLAESRMRRALALVGVYRSIAGGWTLEPLESGS